jgi:hypothetical protein
MNNRLIIKKLGECLRRLRTNSRMAEGCIWRVDKA